MFPSRESSDITDLYVKRRRFPLVAVRLSRSLLPVAVYQWLAALDRPCFSGGGADPAASKFRWPSGGEILRKTSSIVGLKTELSRSAIAIASTLSSHFGRPPKRRDLGAFKVYL
jgi:hypothetical protein